MNHYYYDAKSILVALLQKVIASLYLKICDTALSGCLKSSITQSGSFLLRLCLEPLTSIRSPALPALFVLVIFVPYFSPSWAHFDKLPRETVCRYGHAFLM